TLKVYPYTDDDIEAQQQAVLAAQAALQLKLQPSTDTDLEAQRQAVRAAQATLSEKQTPYLPSDIAAARAALAQAQTSLQNALTNLSDATIVAPYDGVIGTVNIAVDENSLSGVTGGGTGTGGSNGGNGITIINPASLVVYAQVDESDISQVEVGQKANVTFDGLPGRRFPGTVTAVSPASTTTQGVVGYQVTIQLQNAQGVRQGMTASAEIVTAERDGVLMVPNRALSPVRAQGGAATGGQAQGGAATGGQAQGGAATGGQAQRPPGQAQRPQGQSGQPTEARTRVQQRQVQVQTPNGIEARTVQIGISNDTNTEVVSGLEEGDVVVLPTTAARAAVPGARPGGAGITTFGPGPVARPGGF